MENITLSITGLHRLIDGLGRAQHDSLHVAGPHPEPWRMAALASSVVSQLLARHELATTLGATQADEGLTREMDDIGDWVCGNDLRRVWVRYHLVPWHWPNPPDPPPVERGDPIDQVAFGARLLWAAQLVDNPAVASAFSRNGQRIVEAGAKALDTAPGIAR